jgi:mitochondrial fission protein ELM1
MKLIVWIVSEGSPGHVSQSMGLVGALSRHIEMEPVLVEAKPELGGFGRALLKLWMGRKGRRLPHWILKLFFGFVRPDGNPDLLVASGGKSVFAARSLALRENRPLVFIGERKPFPSAWFHTVLTPSEFERDQNDVPLKMIPTSVTSEKLEKAACAWIERPEGPLWAMVLGGKSLSHSFTEQDWKGLGRAMNRLSEMNGIRWLVTSSRRTGGQAEAWLRESLDSNHVAGAVWWSEKPEKLLYEYLGSAGQVFVTQDSVTMVTEATACKSPPVVLTPAQVRFPKKSFLPRYFQELDESGLIVRRKIEDLGDFELTASEKAGVHEDPLDLIARVLLARLCLDQD